MKEFLIELAELLEIDSMVLREDYQLEENANWDSLALISVIVMIDEHFQQSVSNDVLRKCKVVGDLLKLIDDNARFAEV